MRLRIWLIMCAVLVACSSRSTHGGAGGAGGAAGASGGGAGASSGGSAGAGGVAGMSGAAGAGATPPGGCDISGSGGGLAAFCKDTAPICCGCASGKCAAAKSECENDPHCGSLVVFAWECPDPDFDACVATCAKFFGADTLQRLTQ